MKQQPLRFWLLGPPGDPWRPRRRPRGGRRRRRRATVLRRQQTRHHLGVLLLVARLEPDLRVFDDAPGVNDVGRSPIGIETTKVRVHPFEDRIGETHLAAHPLCGLAVWVHRDREHKQPVLRLFLVQLLEMDHLLAGEASIPREEEDRGLGMRRLAILVGEEELPVNARELHRTAGAQRGKPDSRKGIASFQPLTSNAVAR
jgi:hypothetical protein